MKILSKSIVVMLCFVGLTGIASAATILNPPNHIATQLQVGAFRSSNFPRDNLFPTALPFTGTHEVVNVDEISNATYELTDTFFKIDFIHIGNSVRFRIGGQTHQDGATTASSVRFAVDVDTPYTLVGHYNAVGLRGKFFGVMLTNASSTTPNYQSWQDTEAGATAAQNFVVGGTAGTNNNILVGSSTGMLTAGERYTFWLDSVLANQVVAPPSTSTGTGSVTLFLGPVTVIPLPPAAVLMLSCLLGLALKARRKGYGIPARA